MNVHHIVLWIISLQECIRLGVCKFNVNTEVRKAYLKSWHDAARVKDITDAMQASEDAMVSVIANKMRLFGSAGKA